MDQDDRLKTMPETPAPGLSETEKFKLCHDEIHKERAYISNRVGWYVAAQAFLTAAFAAGLEKDAWWFSGILLPTLGSVISWYTKKAVDTARVKAEKMREHERELMRDDLLNGVFGQSYSEERYILARALPRIFLAAWLVMLISFWLFRWIN